MPPLVRTFYLFTGFHSFLLGLLPIFIPVMLWDRGFTIEHIAYFIAATSIGFLIALVIWDKLRAGQFWRSLISVSFLSQSLVVIILLWGSTPWLMTIGPLINGIAGCFYWTTQRLLFQAITADENTGNTFGNFQILVAFLLKIGVLVGSFYLDAQYLVTLFSLSLFVSAMGYFMVMRNLNATPDLFSSIPAIPALGLKNIISFKDNYKSKRIFCVDGLFLFLESYFWVLTLYRLAKENIMQLGILIVVLSVLLALIFFVLKKKIDHINGHRIYMIAVFGFALSWLLRGELNEQMNSVLLYLGMLLIAFLSNFFRLAFNKRFYDIARRDNPIQYILLKSYYSQFMLIFFFSCIAALATLGDNSLRQLQILYDLAVALTLFYLFYGKKAASNS